MTGVFTADEGTMYRAPTRKTKLDDGTERLSEVGPPPRQDEYIGALKVGAPDTEATLCPDCWRHPAPES